MNTTENTTENTTDASTHRARGTLAALLLASCLFAGAAGCAGTGQAERDEARAQDDDAFATGGNQPANANTLHALARILAAQGRDAECEYLLTRILQQHPHFLPAYSDLAELYMRGSRTDDALRVLNVGLSRAAKDPVLLNNVGMCWFLRAEYGKALDAFTAAAATAPNDPACRANRAAALGMLGRYDEAGRVYETVLQSPGDVAHNLAVLRSAREQATAPPELLQPPLAGGQAPPAADGPRPSSPAQ